MVIACQGYVLGLDTHCLGPSDDPAGQRGGWHFWFMLPYLKEKTLPAAACVHLESFCFEYQFD